MKHSNIIFHQLLKHLPRHCFQKTVDRHQGDRRVRTLSCWNQMVALLFGQLSGRQSLRDLVAGFNSKHAHHYHLGAGNIKRSSLSDANNKRPAAIFTETFFYLLAKIRNQLAGSVAKEMIRLIDATTIDLNFNQFKWAKFRSTKSGIKLHTVYDPEAEVPVYFAMTTAKVNDRKGLDKLPILANMTYVVDRAYNDYRWYYNLTQIKSIFVGRMKSSARYAVLKKHTAEGLGILSDETIELSGKRARIDCPTPLRRIRFIREEDQKILVFITNDFDRSAVEIAALYKRRWQIELFFKWVKQNLKIKKFLGRSENAVRIQILSAMITYLLLKLMQLAGQFSMSLQKMSRLVGLNLTSRRSAHELFEPDKHKKKTPEPLPQMTLELIYA